MESDERRPDRKRKAKGVDLDQKSGVVGEGETLVGSYVGKEPALGAGRALLGKVASWYDETGLFRVIYENGECEDLEREEVCNMVMRDEGGSGMKMSCRKRKLDQLAPTAVSMAPPNTRRTKHALEAPDGSQASSGTQLASNLSLDVDSSCDFIGMPVPDSPIKVMEMPALPPSSGDIMVPEELISYLFSVYNFLRSFSLQLFLSPFGLHDFVGALNCTVQNTLLDAVHVSLMRALRRHLETLSSEESKPALRCLRHYDWTLLDPLTWPAFLVEYLYLVGYTKKIDEEDFSRIVAESEYYALPVAIKLKILQILCDDIIDSAELRAELENRESMDEEKEYVVGGIVPPESTPRRVHPRYSKTSAWKESEAMATSDESNKLNSGSIVTKPDEGALDDAQDVNSDECRLCGMDGTLICCDGCPDAYHNRCIGLNKMLLPDGLWFCPECTVNKLGKTSSRIGRGTRGAEVFGIDSYGRMFLGSCNYLLVLGTSLDIEPVYKYYNHDDVTKVLSVICSKGDNLSSYVDICRGISQYWEVPLFNTQSEKTESITNLLCDNDIEGQSHANNITESSASNREILSQKRGLIDLSSSGSALDLVDTSTKKTPEATDRTSSSQNGEQFVTGDGTGTVQKIIPSVQNIYSNHVGNGSAARLITNVSYLSQPISAERSTVLDIATSASGNEIDICREDAGSSVLSKKNDSVTVSVSVESGQGWHSYSEKCKTINEKSSNVPSPFKPQAYINLYILGDIAASAAANLAVLSSEESRPPEAQVYSNPRKAAAATVALQMKAFSGAAMHFLWPSYEKKLMEVPRERCGWCFACKGASTNKRGCFLNLAAANAIKGSARSISGLRPIKYDESHLPVIAAHIANMEETLDGLLIGSFLDAVYTQKWRKQVREAPSFRMLKSLLLELEKNIRGIAFSGDWIKVVDDWSVETSATTASTSHSGPNQKRGPGRRNKKQSLASKLVQTPSDDLKIHVQWWRGGKLSKIVFQKGLLPGSLVKKAARQGGRKRVSGITYQENSGLPRRTRQFAWRASVEMTKNASQLALQVRYLDVHLRWRELVLPDQSFQEGKGSHVDASVFRNAVICDKRIDGNKIAYALNFDNQKHLPSRVKKNILESESTLGENGKLWFSENHIPLYLIKDFEEAAVGKPSPSTATSLHHPLMCCRKLKSRRRDTFQYLMDKLVIPKQCTCASCQVDLLFRDAVKCNTCEGYCHKDCMIPSTINKEDDLEFLFMCNSCYCAKSAALIKSREEALKAQMPSPMQSQQKTGIKCILKIGARETLSGQLPPQGQGLPLSAVTTCNSKRKAKGETLNGQLSSVTDRNSKRKAKSEGCQYSGLLWKRKPDSINQGMDFRLENIILKSKAGTSSLRKPTCCVCLLPYCSDLMYVRCEKCTSWFHADALNLDEAQIFDLIGFKCGKCRRKSMPRCPYSCPKKRKPISEEQRTVANLSALVSQPKVDNIPLERMHKMEVQTNGPGQKSAETTATISYSEAEDLVIAGDDPLLPLGRVEPVELMLEYDVQPNGPRAVPQVQQKLSVRRPQVKQETKNDVFNAVQNAYSSWPAFTENIQNGTDAKESMGAAENVEVEWDLLDMNFEDMVYGTETCQLPGQGDVKLEDTEYEPQTWFSFTELLASEDGGVDNKYDDLGTMYQDPMDNKYDDLGTMYQDPSYVSGLANAPAFDGVVCEKCKIKQPFPDLMCEVCGLRIHSHCSPWVESEELSGGGPWKCGRCREWR